MTDPAILSIVSVIIFSLMSFVGVLTLVIKDIVIRKFLLYFVGFSAGALLGDAFFHLLPEDAATGFIIEKAVHWRHYQIPTSRHHVHSFAYMNLFGGAVHNFKDGLILSAYYLI